MRNGTFELRVERARATLYVSPFFWPTTIDDVPPEVRFTHRAPSLLSARRASGLSRIRIPQLLSARPWRNSFRSYARRSAAISAGTTSHECPHTPQLAPTCGGGKSWHVHWRRIRLRQGERAAAHRAARLRSTKGIAPTGRIAVRAANSADGERGFRSRSTARHDYRRQFAECAFRLRSRGLWTRRLVGGVPPSVTNFAPAFAKNLELALLPR